MCSCPSFPRANLVRTVSAWRRQEAQSPSSQRRSPAARERASRPCGCAFTGPSVCSPRPSPVTRWRPSRQVCFDATGLARQQRALPSLHGRCSVCQKTTRETVVVFAKLARKILLSEVKWLQGSESAKKACFEVKMSSSFFSVPRWCQIVTSISSTEIIVSQRKLDKDVHQTFILELWKTNLASLLQTPDYSSRFWPFRLTISQYQVSKLGFLSAT